MEKWGAIKLGIETKEESGDEEKQLIERDEEEEKMIQMSFFKSTTSALDSVLGISAPNINKKVSWTLPSSTEKLLKENSSFLKFPIDEDAPYYRGTLPSGREKSKKISLWKILKNCVGKDLTRVALPVYLCEPLSMTQKLAEPLEFAGLLREANLTDDSQEALLKVTAFILSANLEGSSRMSKPFNPLLGETFELELGDIRFLAEQVSHHPPITAFHCESPDFLFSGWVQVKMSLSLGGLLILPLGRSEIYLKRLDRTYTFSKPSAKVSGLVFGDPKLEVAGEFSVLQVDSKSRCVLTLRGAGQTIEVSGQVTDAQNKPVISVSGRWDQGLFSAALPRGPKVELCRARPVEPNPETQGFSLFVANLNFLSPHNLYHLAPTDSRFRPDIRALEHGDLNLAETEKSRLEDGQRARKSLLSQKPTHHQPLWFKQTEASDWTYAGGYWEARAQGNWTQCTTDLFN